MPLSVFSGRAVKFALLLFTFHAVGCAFSRVVARYLFCLNLSVFSCARVPKMDEKLLQFGQQLPTDNKFQAIYKLALLRKSEIESKTDDTEICRKCKIPWADGFFSFELIPRCKRSQRQIQALQARGELTKRQQSLVNYLCTRVGRTAKYTCQLCSYKTRVQLDGKLNLSKLVAPEEPSKATKAREEYEEWLKQQQKKRKRHGKSTAGLKIPKMGTENSSNSNTNTNTNTNNTNVTTSGQAKPAAKPTTNAPQSKFGKQFLPTDFRLIQQMLASNVAPNADAKPKQKPLGTQPVRLRFGRS
uniref:Uncharacterized protein n=1 Tax=Anopheles dirus TaxID=7168 RepID=A0A182MZB0_9DIPT